MEENRQRIRAWEYPNLFYLPESKVPRFDEGLVRFDHMQAVRRTDLRNRRSAKLSEDALAAMEEWLFFYLTGRMPKDSLIESLRTQLRWQLGDVARHDDRVREGSHLMATRGVARVFGRTMRRLACLLFAVTALAGITSALASPVVAAITLGPAVGPPTTRTNVTGSGFGSSEAVDVTIDSRLFGVANTDGSGGFALKVKIPKTVLPGAHVVDATGETSGLHASATFTVRTDWSMWRFSLDRAGVNSFENVLSAANVGSLQVAWTAPAADGVGNAPAVANSIVYFGDSLGGDVYAVDASTGALIWTVNIGQGVSPPVVGGGVVYVGNGISGTLYALDAQTGATIWSKNPGGSTFFAPALKGGILYVPFGGFSLEALNAATGAVIWADPSGGGAASPAVVGNTVYTMSSDYKLRAINASTGAVLWATVVADLGTTPAVVDGTIYLGTYNLHYGIRAYSAATGNLLWTHQVGDQVLSSPAVWGGLVFAGSQDGNLYALHAATGTLAWKLTTGGPVYASPALANGIVYIGSQDDHLYAVNATTGAVLGSWLTGGSLDSPAVADGVVYIGSSDKNLYAFDLP